MTWLFGIIAGSLFIEWIIRRLTRLSSLFFFNDSAPTEIYTLSLHDALPISRTAPGFPWSCRGWGTGPDRRSAGDRKSTRLNSSHVEISYAVFCLKKKKQ